MELKVNESEQDATVGKGENAGDQHFFFPTIFSNL